MKRPLLFLFFLFLLSGAVVAQDGFYFAYAHLNAKELKVGRARVYSQVFSAPKDADRNMIKAEFLQYLAISVPKKTYSKYFKRPLSRWSDVSTSTVYIYGPFSYSQADIKLRKSMNAARSQDWLALTTVGFALKPQ